MQDFHLANLRGLILPTKILLILESALINITFTVGSNSRFKTILIYYFACIKKLENSENYQLTNHNMFSKTESCPKFGKMILFFCITLLEIGCENMEWLKLIGIILIMVGFLLKLDTIAIIIIAAFTTALISGLSLEEFLATLGEAFVNNRLVSIFFLTLPMIGLSESHGLKQQAVKLIQRVKGLTTGKFLTIYLLIRELSGFLSLRLGGHPEFVRPLVHPMAEASAEAKYGELDEKTKEEIKARAAATENFGNFFAQNTFVAASGVLLIAGSLESLGYPAPAASIAKASLPVAIIMLIIGIIYNAIFDRKLNRRFNKK